MKYFHRPTKVEAFQLLQNDEDDVFSFVNNTGITAYFFMGDLIIKNPDGDIVVEDRDFVIKSSDGLLSVMNEHDFYLTYDH